VTHEDGRTTDVCAPDLAGAKRQANHQETTRMLIASRRGLPAVAMSLATTAVCLESE
jgi:hypothetical protein